MDFIDEARIFVRAGNGGAGCVAFRREQYVPKGGPDGGDGGHGGNVRFVASHQLSTLLDFKYRQHYEAEDGRPGGGSQKTGKSGDELVVQVPVGTLLKNFDTKAMIADLHQDGETVVIAKGGRGGKGNMFFATSTHQTPRFAQEGEKGESLTLHLELKLLADVALVGFPNAGKSTLISSISAAKPKIAPYPFTTLVPHLGVVEIGRGEDRRTFVAADIPGLVEGAHGGKGLGIRFLKHIERSRILWILIDPSDPAVKPKEAFRILKEELQAFREELARRPFFVVVNKIDLQPERAELEPFLEDLRAKKIPVFEISAATRQGLEPLLWATWQELDRIRQAERKGSDE